MAEYNETSRKIMKVALTLFSEQGYYSTTTKQIAQEAGVNELTIFRHFGSKANLFQVTTEEYVVGAHIEKVLYEDMIGLDYEHIIHLLIDRIYKLYKANTKLYKVQLKLGDNEGGFVKLKLSRKMKEVVETLFYRLEKDGVIKGNPEVMATTLINCLLGILTVDILSDGQLSNLSEEEKVQEIIHLFIVGYKNN